jgi:CHAT domain-containing protein
MLGKYFHGEVFRDNAATRENFLNNCKDYELVHLALHTELNDANPLYSKLLFSSGTPNTYDSMFAYEIFGSKLHAKLLVLSGCNTGSGKLEYSEGVMSLARSFFYSGVDNVIVTQWSVADKSSAALMNYFYTHLKSGESADVALQHAKLDFLHFEDPLKSHPYYWAGYISVGKPVSYYTSTLSNFILVLIVFAVMGLFLYFGYYRKRILLKAKSENVM